MKQKASKNKDGKKESFEQTLQRPLLLLMTLVFITIATTGLLKFRELFRILNISQTNLPMAQISRLHDWSGLTFVVLIIVHLVIKRRWMMLLIKDIFESIKENWLAVLMFIVASGAVITAIYYSNKPKSTSPEIKRLKEVEVREYEGKNLSSIEDFRENSIKGLQYIDIEIYELEITGLVNSPSTFTYKQVLDQHQSYSKVVTLHCVEGWSATILWEGILLEELLDSTEVKKEANTVILYAHDGYSTAIPLEYIKENEILMAYKMNDVVLPPERGYPFQLVAENKWGYKWIKWITKIELSDNKDYEGYWESAGYSNDGDVDGPKFE
jgi:hypothetical protein